MNIYVQKAKITSRSGSLSCDCWTYPASKCIQWLGLAVLTAQKVLKYKGNMCWLVPGAAVFFVWGTRHKMRKVGVSGGSNSQCAKTFWTLSAVLPFVILAWCWFFCCCNCGYFNSLGFWTDLKIDLGGIDSSKENGTFIFELPCPDGVDHHLLVLVCCLFWSGGLFLAPYFQ